MGVRFLFFKPASMKPLTGTEVTFHLTFLFASVKRRADGISKNVARGGPRNLAAEGLS
jgi:hypothetical protein